MHRLLLCGYQRGTGHDIRIMCGGGFPGKGAGRTAAEGVCKIAADKKGEVSLCVEAENKNALHLYESCGFREATEYRYFGCPVAVIDR